MKKLLSRWPAGWGFVGLGMVLAMGSIGCGGPYRAEVSGTVTYKGEPLPGGIVSISHPDGRVGKGRIQEDGSYTVPDAPGGDVRVTVQTVPPIPAPPSFIPLAKLGGEGAKPAPVFPAGPYKKIPDKYSKTETSGLTLEVHRGTNDFDIPLAD